MKISNGHSSETMIDIKTISFLQSPLVKYATFDRNEKGIRDIMIFFLSKFWSNKQLLVLITFHLKSQFWSMTCQLRSYGRIVGLVLFYHIRRIEFQAGSKKIWFSFLIKDFLSFYDSNEWKKINWKDFSSIFYYRHNTIISKSLLAKAYFSF